MWFKSMIEWKRRNNGDGGSGWCCGSDGDEGDANDSKRRDTKVGRREENGQRLE